MITQKLKAFVSAMSLEGLATPEAPPNSGADGSRDSSMEDLADCWTVPGVEYEMEFTQLI